MPKLNYIERVDKWKSDVPDGWGEEYQDLLGDGLAPEKAAAVIAYVAGNMDDKITSQKEISEQYDISKATIRNHYPKITPDGARIDNMSVGHVTVTENTTPETKHKTRSEIIEMLANELNWNEARGSHADSGEYSSSYQQGGFYLTPDAFESLTGESESIDQILALHEKFGLVVGEDVNINFSINKSALEKIYIHSKKSEK